MNKQKKIEIAVEATRQGIGPDDLKEILKVGMMVGDLFSKTYKANLNVLDEMFPEESDGE